MTEDVRAALEPAGARAREATAERDDLIALAVAEGVSMREVGRLVGLSHTAVRQIVARVAAAA